jgi:20S proteasome subunit alpha 4
MGRYDRALSIFSPDGRIFQVEYAQLASERGSIVVFLAGKDEIAVAIEKRMDSKLRIVEDTEKFREVEDGIYLTFAGLWPDSLLLRNTAIEICRSFAVHPGEKITLEKLSLLLSDYVQRFTIKGGMRPFGAKIVLLGFNGEGPLISLIEPDGNYSFYRAGAIGQKSEKASEELEKNAEMAPLSAVVKTVAAVAQKDPAKMSVFAINRECARILTEEEIATHMK